MNNFDTKRLMASGAALAAAVVIVAVLQHAGIAGTLTSPEQTAAPAASSLRTHSPAATSTPALGKVNINTADPAQLMTLHGIGPAKADAIVRYRVTHGPFHSLEDITKVSGIGQAVFDGFRDRITVGEIARPPAPAPTASSSPASAAAARIEIEEVMAGRKGNGAYEYVELYNADDMPADLSHWSLKKKSSTGMLSMLVAASHLSGKKIPAHKYLLLANAGYTGTPAADVSWPSSYTFARTNNALLLYDGSVLVDTAAWSDIPEGKSYARASPGGNFTIAEPSPQNSSN